MIDKLMKSKLMFWSLELLILASLIFVSSQIKFLFAPLFTFISTLFAPILIAGFLFYVLNPLVQFLQKRGIKKNLAVAIVFLVLIGALVLLFVMIIPNLVKQFGLLINATPGIIAKVEQFINDVVQHPQFKNLDIESYLNQLDISFGEIIKSAVNNVTTSIGAIVSSVASVLVVVLTVPFILFYMLKDGDRFIPSIQKYFPKKHEQEITSLLAKMNRTISKYISGQVIECTFVAIGTFIGYLLIGVDYAFLFGCIAGVTNMIPYIGPYLGLAPAVFVTVFTDPWKALLACVVVLIVQQLDGNIVFPNVIGKSLDIHPLTIILILLVAGNIAGLLGMILGVPFYAVVKTIVVHVYDIIKLNQHEKILNRSKNS